jgi:26S proteasome regulatory subunit T1
MTQSAINTYLDSAIRNRIAVRLIAGQHISISHALHDHKAIHTIGSQQDVVAPIDDDGVVDMRCSPLEIIEDVELHVREMCEATFGVAPKIVVDGHVDVRFA